jgi:hypothetical protein
MINRNNFPVACTLRRNAIRLWLLVTANVASSSSILVTLMMEEIRSSETSVVITATWRYIPKDGILHSLRGENLKSYIALIG